MVPLIPKGDLREPWARSTGLLPAARARKVDIVALVYTLVLGFDRGAKRTVASLRRAYAISTETTLAPSAFYDRFTPALAELMRELTMHAFERLSRGNTKLHGALSAFAKVAIADGSIIRLHDALRPDYPSVWTNHTKAGAKLHAVIDRATRTPTSVKIVPGSRHDLPLLSVGPEHRGTLFVFDLAYYQGKLFQRILDARAHFLCRVKRDANFLITAASTPALVGERHREILKAMTGKSFELEVDYEYRHIPERDWTKRHIALRLIVVWCPAIAKHRLYLTSTASTELRAEVAPAVYAMRWEIEPLTRRDRRGPRREDPSDGLNWDRRVVDGNAARCAGGFAASVLRPTARGEEVWPRARSRRPSSGTSQGRRCARPWEVPDGGGSPVGGLGRALGRHLAFGHGALPAAGRAEAGGRGAAVAGERLARGRGSSVRPRHARVRGRCGGSRRAQRRASSRRLDIDCDRRADYRAARLRQLELHAMHAGHLQRGTQIEEGLVKGPKRAVVLAAARARRGQAIDASALAGQGHGCALHLPAWTGGLDHRPRRLSVQWRLGAHPEYGPFAQPCFGRGDDA